MPKNKLVLDFAANRGWTRVGEVEWRELETAFPRVTAASLIKGAIQAGIPVDQPFRGIEQQTLDELEASLIEMAEVYLTRTELRAFARKQVIAAKDRARWASRNQHADEAARLRKAEMLEWMLVWLDDPAMFATWAQMRRNRMTADMEAGVLPPDGGENQSQEG